MQLPKGINLRAFEGEGKPPNDPPHRESPYDRSDIRGPDEAERLLATGELPHEPMVMNSAAAGERKVWLTFDRSEKKPEIFLPIFLNWSGPLVANDDWITIGVMKGAALDICGLWWERCWQWASNGNRWNTGWTLEYLRKNGWENTPEAVWFTWKASNRTWWGIEKGGFR